MALGLRPLEIVVSGAHPLLIKADQWTRVFLSGIAHVQNGFAFKSSCFDLSNGVPLIRIRDISKGGTEHRYLGEFDDQYLVETGEILIGMDGDFAVSRWSGGKALLNQRVCKITLTSDLFDEGFLFLCLQPFLDAINAETSSVTVKHLSSKTIEEIPLPLPPLMEQRRLVCKIEELFSELDKGVESLETARAQFNVYRQAVLKHAFEGRLTAQWREENKDKLERPEQLLARIKREREARYERQLKEWEAAVKGWEESGKPGKRPPRPRMPLEIADVHDDVIAILPELPDCWRWVRVRDCCEVVRGGSPRPAGDTRYYDGTIPFLKVADLTRTKGAYLDTHSFSIKEAGLQKTRLVEPPILMLSNSGATLGIPKVCRIKTTFNDGIAAFLGLDPDDLLYHYYFWTSKTLQLRAINQGAAQPNLNTDLIKETLIPLCTHEEMRIVAKHVGRLLSMCDQLIAGIESQLIRSNALRQSILRQAFAGQLVAQDPKDEPASVLLDRIRAEREQAVKNNVPGKTKKRAAA